MKRKVIMLLGVCVLSLGIAACGDKKESDTSTTTTTEAESQDDSSVTTEDTETNDNTTTATEETSEDLFGYEEVDGGVMINEYYGFKENKSIIIPEKIDGEKVVAIGSLEDNWKVFGGDSVIEEVTIPDTVEIIGKNSFVACTSLSTVNFGSGVKEIGDKAFESCNLKTIELPDGLESIGYISFLNNHELESVVIPASCTEIGECNFYPEIEQVTIKTPSGSYAEQYAEDNGFGVENN